MSRSLATTHPHADREAAIPCAMGEAARIGGEGEARFDGGTRTMSNRRSAQQITHDAAGVAAVLEDVA